MISSHNNDICIELIGIVILVFIYLYYINNYRPISVMSTVSRIFEKLVYNQLESYLVENNLICSHQSGFRPMHSTMTAL